MIADSPGPTFPIKSILVLKNEDFIISDTQGSFCYYETTNQTRDPFKMLKSHMPLGVDQENEKWNRHLEDQSSIYFPATGMDRCGDFLIYTTSRK